MPRTASTASRCSRRARTSTTTTPRMPWPRLGRLARRDAASPRASMHAPICDGFRRAASGDAPTRTRRRTPARRKEAVAETRAAIQRRPRSRLPDGRPAPRPAARPADSCRRQRRSALCAAVSSRLPRRATARRRATGARSDPERPGRRPARCSTGFDGDLELGDAASAWTFGHANISSGVARGGRGAVRDTSSRRTSTTTRGASDDHLVPFAGKHRLAGDADGARQGRLRRPAGSSRLPITATPTASCTRTVGARDPPSGDTGRLGAALRVRRSSGAYRSRNACRPTSKTCPGTRASRSRSAAGWRTAGRAARSIFCRSATDRASFRP